MSGINKVILVGHLGKDPELRTASSGDPFCGFSLATSRSWTDKQGVRQDKTTWHRVTVWGREAETCAAHLGKGSLVGIEGSMEQREYTNREGQVQRVTEIRSQRVTFLGSKKAATSTPGQSGSPTLRGAEYGSYEQPPPPDDSDIPF